MEAIRVYYGVHRVLSVVDGWYRPSREPGGNPQLILLLLLRNGRRVIVRESQVPGVMQLWAQFINFRRECSESESSTEESSSSSEDDETEDDDDDDDGNDDSEKKKKKDDDHDKKGGPSSGHDGTAQTSAKVDKTGKGGKMRKVQQEQAAKQDKPEGANVTVVLERLPARAQRQANGAKKDGTRKTENKRDSSSSSSFNSLFDSSPTKTPGSSPKKPEQSLFTCTFTGCRHSCRTAGGLTSHWNTVHERGRKITCDFCKKQYSYSNLSSHKKRCTQNPNRPAK